MQFARLELNIDDYRKELVAALENPKAILYFDTNILFWLYRLNSSARTEFFHLINEWKSSQKVHLPAWVANEYNKHVVKDNQDTFSPFKKLANTLTKNVDSLMEFAHLLVDDNFVSGTNYSSRTDLIRNLESAKESIIKDIALLKGGNPKKIIHDEIKAAFQDIILDNNIYTFLDEANVTADIRYQHSLPPGFEDDDKIENRYGDLILWREVLEHSKASVKDKQVTTVIIVSNDTKSDWVYKPQNLILENGQTTSNSGKHYRQCYVTAPQLANEIRCHSGITNLYVIDIYLLVELLYKSTPTKLGWLAIGTQIISRIDSLASNENNGTEEAASPEASLTTTAPVEEVAVTQTAAERSEATGGDEYAFTYSASVVADSEYAFSEANPLDRISQDLKSHNWYVQNPAIDSIIQTIKAKDAVYDKDSLFILGRNILQSANGGAFSAQHFVSELLSYLSIVPTRTDAIHILNGILFEQYFDSTGQLRARPVYADFSSLNAICRTEDYRESAEFLHKKLQEANALTLFIPGQRLETVVITAEVETRHEIENSPVLLNLTFNGQTLLNDGVDQWHNHQMMLNDAYTDSVMSKENIIDRIAQIHKIPSSILQIYNPANDYFFVRTTLALKDLRGQ